LTLGCSIETFKIIKAFLLEIYVKLNCKITTTIVALDAHESKKSYPNFMPSGYWTLHNYKTRALSLVGLSLSVDSLVTDFVSGGAAVLRNAHAFLEERFSSPSRCQHIGQGNCVKIRNYIASVRQVIAFETSFIFS